MLGFKSTGAITSWLPLFLFVILFGLSMDYHVFIISRIREAYDKGMSTNDAIARGIKSTAGPVTSAAIVMVAVFAIFASLGALEFKQLGVGLAVAILVDATLIRAVLLPATMKLLGDANWLPAQGAPLAAASCARASARVAHEASRKRAPVCVPGARCSSLITRARSGRPPDAWAWPALARWIADRQTVRRSCERVLAQLLWRLQSTTAAIRFTETVLAERAHLGW